MVRSRSRTMSFPRFSASSTANHSLWNRHKNSAGDGTRTRLLQIYRKVTFRSRALKAMPITILDGMLGVMLTVIRRLLVGAAISRNMANFLKENDLFVSPDDDDDDD